MNSTGDLGCKISGARLKDIMPNKRVSFIVEGAITGWSGQTTFPLEAKQNPKVVRRYSRE